MVVAEVVDGLMLRLADTVAVLAGLLHSATCAPIAAVVVGNDKDAVVFGVLIHGVRVVERL